MQGTQHLRAPSGQLYPVVDEQQLGRLRLNVPKGIEEGLHQDFAQPLIAGAYLVGGSHHRPGQCQRIRGRGRSQPFFFMDSDKVRGL